MKEDEILKELIRKTYEKDTGLSLGFIGELGAGKTSLVRKLLTEISKDFYDQVQSPTFTICNQYQVPDLKVYHLDLYRVEVEDEIFELDLFEYLEQPKTLVLIEWIDRFPFIYPYLDHRVEIEILKDEKRDYRLR